MDAVSWNLLSDDEQSRGHVLTDSRGITFTRLKADAPSQSGGS
jgi:hypothetical protein